jgi:tetratricopeptide (TPR) repeat protein
MPKRLLLLSVVAFALVYWGAGAKCMGQEADVSAQFKQADGHRAEKEYSEAEALTAQQKLIILYMAWGKQAQAEAAYEELVREFGGREDLARVLVGEIAGAFREAEEYESAKKVYEYVVNRWPKNELALYSQAGVVKCYLGLRDDGKAQAALAELFARFSGHEKMRSVVHDLAFEYRSMRKWAESRELFRYFLEHWPDDEGAMKAQRLVVKTSIRLGDDPNADAAIEELIRLFGDKSDIRREMSEIANDWTESGRYEKAVPQYKYVVEHWPEHERAAWTQMALAATTAALGDEAGVTAALDKLGADFGADATVAKLLGPFGGFCRHLLQVPNKQSKAVWAVISGKLLGDFADRDAVKVVDHIGDFYRDTRQYEKAVEAYEEVAKTWPESERAIESKTSAVKVYISIGDEPKASAAFERLTEKFASNERIGWAVWEVGEAYREDGSVKKAYEKYKQVVERWPESEQAIWAKMGMVRSLVRQSDLEGAEAELGELLTNFGGHKDVGPVVHEIVEEYRNTGAYEEGRGLFAYLLENWDESDSTMLELRVGVALQSIKLGELDKADAAVQRLIADYNDHANLAKALFQIAEEYLYAGKYHKAIELWASVRSDYWDSEFPNKEEVTFMLGNCHQLLDDHNTAIQHYKQTLQEYPGGRRAAEACYETGMIYFLHKKEYGKAAEWLEKSLQVRQDNKEEGERALFHLVVIYTQKLPDFARSIAAAEQYMQEYPQGAGAWGVMINLASCHEQLGNKQEAIAVLLQAYELRTDEGLRSYITERIARLVEGGA